MNYNHLIDLNYYSVEQCQEIIELAIKINNNPEKYLDSCKGKILATLFYEPSTRTQMSFQTAMLRLGGQVIGFDNPSNSSVAKGEGLADTIKTINCYADIITIRSPIEGSAKYSALNSELPVINAGDGGHLHPTQTLTDLLTLKIEKGRLENLKIGICGDLKFGRTVHSLIKALSRYKNNTFILISTENLKIPEYIKEFLIYNNCDFEEVFSLDEAIFDLDILYMTRIQKERFKDEQEYLSQKDVYILDCEKLKKAKKELIIMHPLPRVDEIDNNIDKDERAIYFKQARYGVYARMALILKMLESKTDKNILKGNKTDLKCLNEKCICNTEKNIHNFVIKSNNNIYCEYCEKIIK